MQNLLAYDEGKVKAELTKELMRHVFSEESSKIIQNTQIKEHELPTVYALEMMNHFLLKRFCMDKFLRQNFQAFIDRFYQARVSLDRQGRKELFDALKTESIGLSLGLQQNEEIK